MPWHASTSGWHRKSNTAAAAARRAQYASPEHRAKRAAFARLVASGGARCWRCGRSIRPGDKWHAGHDDNDRSVYRGVECPPCNLRAAARKGAAVVNARRRTGRATTSRRW